MSINNSLFYLPNYDKIAPRTIRIKNIVNQLKKEHINVKILKINYVNCIGQDEIELKSGLWSKLFLKLKLFHILLKLKPSLRLVGVDSIFNSLNIRDISKAIKMFDIKNLIIVISPFTSLLIVDKIRIMHPELNIILDIGDPLYMNSARWNDDPISYKIELKALKNADKIIVTNNETRKFYAKLFGIDWDKLFVIPQGVNIDLVEDSKLNVKRKTEREKIKLIYGGRFYSKLRNPKYLFNYLKDNRRLELDVYGSNDEYNVSHINFIKKTSQEILFKRMFESDFIVFIDNAYGNQTSGKIYELLAFKKPILFLYSNENSPLLELVEEYSNVFTIRNNEIDIERKLSKLEINDSEDFDYSLNQFDWKNRAEQYKDVLG